MGIRPNQATSEDYHRVHSPVDGTIVSIRGYEKDELFPGAVLRHRNGDVESYPRLTQSLPNPVSSKGLNGFDMTMKREGGFW